LFIIFRCQLRDLGAESREKDAQISELKAEVDRLTSADKELEAQTGELQVGNLQVSEVKIPIVPLHCECMVLFLVV